MVAQNQTALYSINTTTGAASRIGSATNFGNTFHVEEGEPGGLTSFGGTLYMVGAGLDRLYFLDTTTGQAAFVTQSVTAFGVNELAPSALTEHDGKLYMSGQFTDALYTLDTDTMAEVIRLSIDKANSLNVSANRTESLRSTARILTNIPYDSVSYSWEVTGFFARSGTLTVTPTSGSGSTFTVNVRATRSRPRGSVTVRLTATLTLNDGTTRTETFGSSTSIT